MKAINVLGTTLNWVALLSVAALGLVWIFG